MSIEDSDAEIDSEILIKTVTFSNALHCLETAKLPEKYDTNDAVFSSLHKVGKITISRTRLGERPTTRWLDDVEKDLKLMGINRWKTIVTDRVNWRRITESALACKSSPNPYHWVDCNTSKKLEVARTLKKFARP
ncbi:hypothetical protein TNCV_2981671 [Trichonephila clavipes]|nr:hypothetical protein TNCV_2981671 [Trichonephila clavipes]